MINKTVIYEARLVYPKQSRRIGRVRGAHALSAQGQPPTHVSLRLLKVESCGTNKRMMICPVVF